ncbi:uncharacterized protein LOC143445834 isoform X1 [Clavelina lepadiformis]|uniref:uncharacterized protein LOC143445834 isoform X1 n=2 Tax=Clavelina lepadiformis TaxID=159417 RepID=UPI0040411649
MPKRQRLDLLATQVELLTEYWQQGMRDLSDPRVAEAAVSAHLTENQVKVWIKDTWTKNSTSASTLGKLKNISCKRRVSGYNLYSSSLKKDGIGFRQWATKWKQLSDEKKKFWEKEGQKATSAERLAPITEKRIKHLKNRQLKIIDNACLKLEQVGYVAGGAIYKDGLFDFFACKTATHFFSGTSFQEAFINENHLATFLSDKPSTSRSLKILKKEVRAIFNEKYSEAVKKTTSGCHIPNLMN